MEEIVTLLIFGIIFGLISLFNYYIKQVAEKSKSGEEQADPRTARSSSSFSAPQEEIKQFLQQIKGQAQASNTDAAQPSSDPKVQPPQYRKTDVEAERRKRERARQQRLAQEQKRQQQEQEKQKTTKTAAPQKAQKQRSKKTPAVSAYSTSNKLRTAKSVFDGIGGGG